MDFGVTAGSYATLRDLSDGRMVMGIPERAGTPV